MSKFQSSDDFVHFILIARRLKILLHNHQKMFAKWYAEVEDNAENITDSELCHMGQRERCVSVLNCIEEVYDLYRDNQYAPELKEEYWQSRECLQNEISSFFENEKDLNDVCDLAFMLHKENQHA